LRDDELSFRIAEEIANGKVVSVAKGRMEFGPRALGSRSVLADARDTEMQKRLNLKTKFREGFRPFAPMVLEEDFNNYFNGDSVTSPYMLKTYPVNESIRVTDLNENPNFEKLDLFEIVSRKRSSIPAVTHIDYSARAQTIDQSRNPFIYQVISNFKKITGCSVIVNTSFNVRGEPIVCSSRDAIECFIQTDIDVLVLDSYIIVKNEQKNLKNKSNRKFKDD
jgi:carbamoyltransferase